MALLSAVWSLILAAFCASGQQAGKSRVCRAESEFMGLAVMLRGRMMATRASAADTKAFMFAVVLVYFLSVFLGIEALEMVMGFGIIVEDLPAKLPELGRME